MSIEHSQGNSKDKSDIATGQRGFIFRFIVKFGCRLYSLLAPHAYCIIIFGALFCSMAVKLFHSWRVNMVNEYPNWISADIATLISIEVVLAIVCFRWPIRWVIRSATIFAAIVCTWSVMNAGWLIRTGTQILPTVLLPLFRDPLNALGIIGISLMKMPIAAVILLVPSAIALVFFFCILAKPQLPNHNPKFLVRRIIISVVIITIALLVGGTTTRQGSAQIISAGLSYNCQLNTVRNLLMPARSPLAETGSDNTERKIPSFDQVKIKLPTPSQMINHNIILVVLEGVQHSYTSFGDKKSNLTPYLANLASEGVEFTNTRSTLTHTTKVLFSLLTGRFPSASQDIAETVPAVKPYVSIATILKDKLGFRTAFFQSAKGNFEGRPGLVYNLGFDKFWARDNLNDPNAFIGYLGCDEFSMLKPVTEWIKADEKPFFLTILCSVTHDPYEVPKWFATPAKDSIERYKQSIFYTDKFLASLDVELTKLNLTNKTVLCVIGDHGEAFGEHGLLGHERIVFEEALHIPFCLRAPFLVGPQRRVVKPVSSVDLAPTLLTLLGIETKEAGFDGIDVLGAMPDDRKVYFSGWLQQGPAGFVKANKKFTYYPATNMVCAYDLSNDPLELAKIELPEQQTQEIADEIINWRKNSIFRINQQHTGQMILFDSWLCRWNRRVSSAKYLKKPLEND